MRNYSKIGGILSIVAGGFGLLYFVIAAIVVVAASFGYRAWDYHSYDMYYWDRWGIVIAVLVVVCLVYACLGALAVIGGIFGIRKKVWGLALAGSIAGTLLFFPCGVLSIIFTALGKAEFDALPPPHTA